ncbi:MAG: glucose-6-phosphate isomerase [Bacteroidales bacterium]|nr:glucose-6-phosphate isomerase [Bacteroidales bacterium]MDY3913174.1 glucose-6-phosphate isomerase [Sodaliphilus sp.]
MATAINVDVKATKAAIGENDIKALAAQAASAVEKLENGTGEGSDFLGWMHLPSSIQPAQLDQIEAVAAQMRHNCDYVVAIGIGGSYLGAKAVIEALSSSFAAYSHDGGTQVLFAGNNIGEDYMHDLMALLKGRRFGIVVISKSGTTTEPAIAFRLLKDMLESQVGRAEAAKLIVAITDSSRGALRHLAEKEGYKTFVIPDNVGGRYSVLTPVGLLPVAIAGHDIKALVAGAVEMEQAPDDAARLYAQTRNALYRAGKKIEILVNFCPRLHYLAEWWKQLYGESEGKDHKALFPAAVDDTTDLHSMGQWIQDGERTIFETVISVGAQQHTVVIPHDDADLDGLNYLAGKRIDEVNKMAELGTRIAHVDGGVPNIVISVPEVTERYLGQLIYFFEKACGISGYLLGVNPFDQPGVEGYKRNMFALLNKPGYEAQSAAMKAKLAK